MYGYVFGSAMQFRTKSGMNVSGRGGGCCDGRWCDGRWGSTEWRTIVFAFLKENTRHWIIGKLLERATVTWYWNVCSTYFLLFVQLTIARMVYQMMRCLVVRNFLVHKSSTSEEVVLHMFARTHSTTDVSLLLHKRGGLEMWHGLRLR